MLSCQIILSELYSYLNSMAEPFEVRLEGDSDETQGRVEIMINGSWGTICDDNWDIVDASVVCRMLGYRRSLEATCCAQYGDGEGDVLLSNVSCTGTESNLAECLSSSSTCDHSQDAGVVCTNAGMSGAFCV